MLSLRSSMNGEIRRVYEFFGEKYALFSKPGIEAVDLMQQKQGIPQKTLFNHLAKMPTLAKWLNSDLRVTSGLSKGFTVPQVARKHDCHWSWGWAEITN